MYTFTTYLSLISEVFHKGASLRSIFTMNKDTLLVSHIDIQFQGILSLNIFSLIQNVSQRCMLLRDFPIVDTTALPYFEP